MRSRLLKPDAAEALDTAIIQKAYPAGMNTDAVRTHVVTQRIGDDDALTTWIDGRQSYNTPDCTGLWQFRAMEILALTFQHEYVSYLLNRSNVLLCEK
ncbi:MAG: hypothetical protein R3E39_30720 [Anaerolineae bacterium]